MQRHHKVAVRVVALALPVMLYPAEVGAQQVGTAGAVNPSAQAGNRVLQVGSNVLFKERIDTTAKGSTQIIFVDKTTLNIGPNSSVLIDEFVYNPNAGTGRMTVSLAKGALRIVGGNVSHTEGATIKTPVASIGVRGGVATVDHNTATGTTRAVNHFGTLQVSSGAETQSITRPGFATSVAGVQAAPSPPERATQAEIAGALKALSSAPGQSGGAAVKPTDTSATSAGLGQANAGLVPAQVQSLQGQNASQNSATWQTQAQAVASGPQAEDVIQQGVQQGTAAQIAAPPQSRFYALQTTGVPYLDPSFATSGFYVSPLIGYRRGGTDAVTGADRFGTGNLQAGLAISGTGASQSSSFFVMSGGFTLLSDGTFFHDAGFTATTRHSATDGMGRSSGNADSLAGSELFDSDRLPVGVTLTNNNRLSATGATQATSAFFFNGAGGPNTNYTYASNFTQATIPSGVGSQRSGETLTGFVGGIMRTRHAISPSATSSVNVGLSFPVVGGITVAFDTDRPRLQAIASLARAGNPSGDVYEFNSATLQVGSISAPRGRGTYIDDRLFAGRAAVSNPADSGADVHISTTNGNALSNSHQAFASSDLVNGTGFVQTLAPGTTMCVCEYTRWGAWSADNYRLNGDSSEERDRMHIAMWVAGRLSDPAQIPTIGTATYNGHLVGSIKNSTAGTEYLTAAGFQYQANFGNPGVSTMSVTNLDGANFGGTVGFNRPLNQIQGSMTQTGGPPLVGAQMDVKGAFFRGATDPVKDVAGNWTLKANPVSTPAGLNHNLVGAGIFAGSR